MAEQQSMPQLVVIGSSAGGIDALSTLVASLPQSFPAPIVVAQHLDPRRQSHLADILRRRTPLDVITVETEEALRPGVVYLVPANRLVEVASERVGVREDSHPGPKPSVDLLLDSAAEAFGEGLVAVILTGIGSDGAAGARHVSAAGGTVVIQNPQTASYPSMPLSLSPTDVDIVADLEAIGTLLNDLVTGVYQPAVAGDEKAFRAFLSDIQEQSGIDFRTYKRPTIMRRLQRRMAATNTTQLKDYVRYLRTNPDEYQRLVSSFLIKVTEFFRDPDLFDYLRDDILPRLIAEAEARGGELRLWSAGCATGEEAYSLAILLAEALGDATGRSGVRVFATDLDAKAIAFARRGVYPRSAVKGMDPQLIERYFNENDGEYEIKKQIRLMTVFGEHDLAQRAPFPRIDLAVCRNVLIYFTPELQRRALQLFAFSLRDAGWLVLGKAETTSPLHEYFVLENPKLKVYRRQGERVLVPPARTPPPPRLLPGQSRRRALAPEGAPTAAARSQIAAFERADNVLMQLPVGVVVVNESYDIQFLNAAARRLLGIHTSAIGQDFIHLAGGIDSAVLRKLIDGALRGESASRVAQVAADAAVREAPQWLDFQVQPRTDPNNADARDGVLIVISDATKGAEERRSAEKWSAENKDSFQAALDQVENLRERQSDLLAANQELAAGNAELRAANEELVVSTEEIQAATEEVETLNEELQATNEELETLNEELQATVEELNTTNDDLEARSHELEEAALNLEHQHRLSEVERARLSGVLGHMRDAVVVIRPEGDVLLSNQTYDTMFEGVDLALDLVDPAGHPLSGDRSPVGLAAAGESFSIEFSISDGDGRRRWFEATGGPLSDAGERAGGVIVIRDTTDRTLRRVQEEFIAIAGHELRTPLAALRGYLQLLGRSPEVETSDAARSYASSALIQANRLARLMSEFLDVSRLQYGRLELDRAPIDIVPVIQRALDVAQVISPDQPIRLSGGRQPLIVNGDEVRLEQAILNVVTNGQVHAPESPSVDVTLRGNSTNATITVVDRGAGIDAEGQTKIFERFAKLTDRSRNPSPGLGLGLYITRAIIEGHGGRVELKSKVGEGTTVTIRLPLAGSEQTNGRGSRASTDDRQARLQPGTDGEKASTAGRGAESRERRAPSRSGARKGKS